MGSPKPELTRQYVDCTGDVCVGDTIWFLEAIWAGSYRKPKRIGFRRIRAEVLKDSYGLLKQQHTFTLKVLDCECRKAEYFFVPGKIIRRKGRNIYRNGTIRYLREDEEVRKEILKEKHRRGNNAREARNRRKEEECIL